MPGRHTKIAGGGISESTRSNYRMDAFDSITNFGGQGLQQQGNETGVVHSSYEAIDTLLVTQLDGPFDAENKKVSEIIPGITYSYHAKFNKEASVSKIRSLRWGLKKDGGNMEDFPIDYSSVKQNANSIILNWEAPSDAHEKIRLYAYFRAPSEDISVEVAVNNVLPFYVDRYRLPGKDQTGANIANDMAFGNGTLVPQQSVYSSAQILGLGRLMQLTANASDDLLFVDFRIMARTIFARGELNENIERMIAKFERNEGGIYEDEVLTRHAKEHQSTKRFCASIEDEIAERLKESNGNIEAVKDEQVYFTSHEYGNPRFNSWGDTFAGGLTIAVNDVWSYEIQLTGFRKSGDNYTASYKVTLWDHFGLDLPDMQKKFYYMAGFRAWFVLQHLRSYQPFITKMEFTNEFSGNIKEGKTERQSQRN